MEEIRSWEICEEEIEGLSFFGSDDEENIKF